ncbi:MAG: right-handed parallel beta-helix repeat-containing protein [Verrucomicrobiales bacterium]
MRPLPQLFALLLLTSATVSADELFVSTTGSDSDPGSIDRPYRTIDHAAGRASPGDTIFVRGGVYNELVSPNRSGTSSQRITIRNFPDESPIIDGSGKSVAGQTPILEIDDENYLTIEGFQIRNLTTPTNSRTPLGILVTGSSTGIEIIDCEIYNIRNTGDNGNAHGILVEGTDNTPISGLVIRGNELRDLVLGNSEALVLNGNVDGFEVSGNYVHDCNNLGIDFIGFEGNGPAGQDQARNGVCADNIVTNISTLNNPAYGGYSAGGIYVDGGRDIIIERNLVSHCDIGIELASEDPDGATSNVTVRDNVIWSNNIGGIFVGGYQQRRGAAVDCTIVGNTLVENDTVEEYNGELLVQYNTTNLDVRNNIFVAGRRNVYIIVNNGNNSGITLDYNLYYSSSATSPDRGEWIWNGSFQDGFDEWRSTTGQDANSLYVNPQFSDYEASDFSLSSTSPAIDRGDPAYSPGPDETDAAGNPRISGNRIDIGAYENPGLSNLQLWRLANFGTTENTGDAANSADPDADGLNNLGEFSLADQDPNQPFLEPPVRSTRAGLSFTRNPAAEGEITYRIHAGDDLDSWALPAIRPAGEDWIHLNDTFLSESTGSTVFIDSRPSLGEIQFYRLDMRIP